MAIYKRPRSDYWYYDFTVGPKRYRGSTKTANKRLAEEVEAMKRAEVIKAQALGLVAAPNITASAFADKWWARCRNDYRTPQKYYHFVERFKRHFNGTPLRAIDRDMLEEFLEAVAGGVLSGATVNRHIAFLKRFFREAQEWGYIHKNPAKGIKINSSRESKRIRHLTAEEFQRVWEAAGPNFRPLLVTAVYTGLRAGELIALRWEDIDLERRVLIVRDSKNGDSRVVPLVRQVVEALNTMERKNPVFGYASSSVISHIWRRVARRAGLEDVRFHDLRHTFACWARMRGMDLQTLQKLLGHRNLEVTMRYADIGPAYIDLARRAMSLLE